MTDVTLNGVSITTDASVFQKGTGIKIASGTTDTSLPRAVAEGFSNAWEAATGSVSSQMPLCFTLNWFVGGHVLNRPPPPARVRVGQREIGSCLDGGSGSRYVVSAIL